MLYQQQQYFFKRGILPELLGKWFSKSPTYLTGNVAQDKNKTDDSWCFCRGAESGEIILCDNST